MLCICAGIVEIGLLISAAIVAVFPFLSKLFRRRNKHRGSDCCGGNRPRARYVTSTDVIKMRKRDKK